MHFYQPVFKHFICGRSNCESTFYSSKVRDLLTRCHKIRFKVNFPLFIPFTRSYDVVSDIKFKGILRDLKNFCLILHKRVLTMLHCSFVTPQGG